MKMIKHITEFAILVFLFSLISCSTLQTEKVSVESHQAVSLVVEPEGASASFVMNDIDGERSPGNAAIVDIESEIVESLENSEGDEFIEVIDEIKEPIIIIRFDDLSTDAPELYIAANENLSDLQTISYASVENDEESISIPAESILGTSFPSEDILDSVDVEVLNDLVEFLSGLHTIGITVVDTEASQNDSSSVIADSKIASNVTSSIDSTIQNEPEIIESSDTHVPVEHTNVSSKTNDTGSDHFGLTMIFVGIFLVAVVSLFFFILDRVLEEKRATKEVDDDTSDFIYKMNSESAKVSETTFSSPKTSDPKTYKIGVLFGVDDLDFEVDELIEKIDALNLKADNESMAREGNQASEGQMKTMDVNEIELEVGKILDSFDMD